MDRPVDHGKSAYLGGSRIRDRDCVPCYPQPSTNSRHPGCYTRRPPRNSFVPCLGEAVLSHLVRGQCVMVRLPQKTGERFLPSGMCLPDGKLLPVVMCHPRPTMRHAEFYHVSWGELCCGVLANFSPFGGSNVSRSRVRVLGMEARTPSHTPDST